MAPSLLFLFPRSLFHRLIIGRKGQSPFSRRDGPNEPVGEDGVAPSYLGWLLMGTLTGSSLGLCHTVRNTASVPPNSYGTDWH